MGKINAAVQLTQNRFLNLFKLFAENKNDEPLEYLVASRAEKVDDLKAINHKKKADAVAIVAWHKELQRLVLLKQYRYAIGDYVYELPAGLVEDGEDVVTAAERELYEETGLKLTGVDKNCVFNSYFSSPGMTDETCAIVHCTAVGEVRSDYQERNEEIEVVMADTDEMLRILKKENVCMKTALIMIGLILDQYFPRGKRIGE